MDTINHLETSGGVFDLEVPLRKASQVKPRQNRNAVASDQLLDPAIYDATRRYRVRF